jgi:hypothetical protein
MTNSKNSGAIIVSGCPRSGTSLMMLLLKEALGEDRILGDKFPQQRRREALETQPKDARQAWRLRQAKSEAKEYQEADWFEQIKDMNPNGFWECPYTTPGICWTRGRTKKLNELLEKEKAPVCKVVSQGLALSDPRYIGKIIFMLRDPGSVAKSQERLKKSLEVVDPENKHKRRDLLKGITINNTQMFLRVSLAASQWISEHPDVPVHFVQYDQLLDDAATVLDGVKDFLGEGDFTEAVKLIDPSLKRSAPEWDDGLREDAELVYRKMKEQDWPAIEAFANDIETVLAERMTAWVCDRTGLKVSKRFCLDCVANRKYRQDAIAHAEVYGKDWRNAPCGYEVSYRKDNLVDGFVAAGDSVEAAFEKAVAQSIENNFWLD